MSKASILRQLADEDLEAVHHLIRRDAMSDAAIAAEAARRLPRSTPDARFTSLNAMVITRYRQSAEFKRWLDRWENQDAALKRDLAAQKQRFELVSSLVQGTDKSGLEAVSNGLMARLLTLATELSDDELREAASGQQGWVSKVIRVVQQQTQLDVKTKGAEAADVAADNELSREEQQAKIKEIFGLA